MDPRKTLLSSPRTILEFYKNKNLAVSCCLGLVVPSFPSELGNKFSCLYFERQKFMAVIVNQLLLTMAPQTNRTSLMFVNFMLITKIVTFDLSLSPLTKRDLSH